MNVSLVTDIDEIQDADDIPSDGLHLIRRQQSRTDSRQTVTLDDLRTSRHSASRRHQQTTEHVSAESNTETLFKDVVDERYPFYLFYRRLSVLHSGTGKNITLFLMCKNTTEMASNPSRSTIDQKQLHTTSVGGTYKEQDRIGTTVVPFIAR